MTTQQVLLSINTPIHLIGAGGVGISALGQALLSMGFTVTGSDKEDSIYLQQLQNKGATVWVGSNPKNIASNSIIFYSTAIPETDIERSFATTSGFRIYARHLLLKWITEQYFTIAISGTHGKTTTTAWVTMLLTQAGLAPTAIIGGKALDFNSNFILGNPNSKFKNKPILVIEADESDSSFLWIEASMAIVTNIEMDHVDKHSSLESLTQQFKNFVSKTIKNGGYFIPSQQLSHNFIYECTKDIIETIDHNRSYSDFLYKHSLACRSNIPLIQNDAYIVDSKSHSIHLGDTILDIALMGDHNLYNAGCVLLVALFLGIKMDTIQLALSTFKGVARRMQIVYHKNYLTIMDDYAHHPTEIKAVYDAIYNKELFITNDGVKQPYKKIYVVWEPHRLSRFCYFSKDFIDLFKKIHWI